MDVLEEADGDIDVVLTELRSQSVPATARKQRRASSRSMEDFLTTINTNISDASAAVNEGLTSSEGTGVPPSSSPSKSPRSSGSFSDQVSQAVNRTSLGAVGSPSSSAATAETGPVSGASDSSEPKPAPVATDEALVPDLNDPFAGNDIRGFEEKPPPVSSDDPFACLT